jgi:hypothetical protein
MLKTITIPFQYVAIPQKSIFKDQIDQIISQIEKECLNTISTQKKIIEARNQTAQAIIYGLYDCYKTLNPKTALSVPKHKSAYHHTDPSKINNHSHTVVVSVINALINLDWITYKKGGVINEINYLSTIKAKGYLLELFKRTGIIWQDYSPRKSKHLSYPEVIFVKDASKKIIPTPETHEVKVMRRNVNKINNFMYQQAIYISMTNDNLRKLAEKMAEEKKDKKIGSKSSKKTKKNITHKSEKTFNFSRVGIYRVFARGRLDRGGRFYGPWWQGIPKDYRPYIQINSFPTIEIDYSSIHPKIFYLVNNLKPPEGDLYDIGEEYRPYRGLIKTFFNALINDERGYFGLTNAESNLLGLSTKELINKLCEKHPLLRKIIGKGVGLEYQYIDSRIAEKVMLKLLKQNIVCLPIHDSFIVQARFEKQLIEAMNKAFKEVLKDKPKMSETIQFQMDFKVEFKKEGGIDRKELIRMHEGAVANKYYISWTNEAEERIKHPKARQKYPTLFQY